MAVFPVGSLVNYVLCLLCKAAEESSTKAVISNNSWSSVEHSIEWTCTAWLWLRALLYFMHKSSFHSFMKSPCEREQENVSREFFSWRWSHPGWTGPLQSQRKAKLCVQLHSLTFFWLLLLLAPAEHAPPSAGNTFQREAQQDSLLLMKLIFQAAAQSNR